MTLITEQELYANLMQEAKGRFQIIDSILTGKLALYDRFSEEICYLQLRMLCELIAIGCLIAHGSMGIADIERLTKRYEADEIIKGLEDLNAEFYPHPVTFHTTAPSAELPKGHLHLERKTEGFLTKAELIKLYGRSGNYLHRGKLKKLRATETHRKMDRADVLKWTNKIVTLLDTHHIASFDNHQHWIVSMNDKSAGGLPTVALARSPEVQAEIRKLDPQG